MVEVDPGVQRDCLSVARIVTAGSERCSAQMGYSSFGSGESPLCFDRIQCLKAAAAEYWVVRKCRERLDLFDQ